LCNMPIEAREQERYNRSIKFHWTENRSKKRGKN